MVNSTFTYRQDWLALIIHEDQTERKTLEAALAPLPSATVVGVETLAMALRSLQALRPAVLVLSPRFLTEQTRGLERLREALRERRVPIVIVGRPALTGAVALFGHTDDDTVEAMITRSDDPPGVAQLVRHLLALP